MEIIVGRQGNQKIKIEDKTVSREHCILTEQPDGSYMVENKSANGTFVNDKDIIKTRVTRDTILRLGSQYTVKVADLVGEKVPAIVQESAHIQAGPSKPLTPKTQPETVTVSIKPMQRVWDEYQNSLEGIKAKQKKIQNLRLIAPLFTMASGALTAFQPGAGTPFFVVGLCLTAYAFIKGAKDDSDNLRKEATDKFQENYLCPNCHHTHSQSPKLLLLNKTCPYCKCKYTE